MKIKRISGCTADHLEIDGVDIKSLDDAELIGINMLLLESLKQTLLKESPSKAFDILLDCILPTYSDWDQDACTTCGDTITEEVWEV